MQIQPSPVPASIQVQQVQLPNGQMHVLMTIGDPTGQKFVFISPEAAVSIGQNLATAGRAGNILLPPGTRLNEPEVDVNDDDHRAQQAVAKEIHRAQLQADREKLRAAGNKLAAELVEQELAA